MLFYGYGKTSWNLAYYKTIFWFIIWNRWSSCILTTYLVLAFSTKIDFGSLFGKDVIKDGNGAGLDGCA
jgi:hypothetical protein